MQLSRLLFLTPEKTLRAQDQGDHPRLPDREELHQGGDLHALLQPGLLRPRQLRGGGGQPVLLRQVREGPDPGRGRARRRRAPERSAASLPSTTPSGRSARRNHVLDRMAEEKYIEPEEAEEAKKAPLTLHLRKEPPSIAPYFLEEVRKYLEREYGSQRIYQGGLRVYTTLDPGMQRAGRPRAARGAAHARPPGPRLRASPRRPCSRTGSCRIRCTSTSGTGRSPRATWCAAW